MFLVNGGGGGQTGFIIAFMLRPRGWGWGRECSVGVSPVIMRISFIFKTQLLAFEFSILSIANNQAYKRALLVIADVMEGAQQELH